MSILIKKLRTEYMENPLGIDARQPRLSWILESAEPAQKQTAYRILVASSQEKLQADTGDLWDSGKVQSDQSIHVRYEGKELQSEQLCYWKVMVWDKAGQPSRWSKAALWSMGLLEQAEWVGQWISGTKHEDKDLIPTMYLRKSLQIQKPIRRATIYSTALGVYNLYVNGQKMSEDLFAPGWTDYATRVQYQAYDVTAWLNQGDNALSALLGSGWYCGYLGMMGKETYGDHPYFLCQLHLEYEDGTTQQVVTDESWKTSTGAIQYSDMIKGESFDGTLHEEAWSQPGFKDDHWDTPIVYGNYGGKLTAQVEPPIRVTEQILPVSVSKYSEGRYIFDMGQNMVGWIQLKVKGKRGQQVKVSYAEMLNPDGSLYIENLRKAKQENHYTLGSEQEEMLEPHFTFHGFRYVEVSGLSETPTLDQVIGKVIHSVNTATGSLETSDVMVNKLHDNVSWGQRGNFLSVPTDCPQRDERLGWTGDAQIFVGTACYLVDAARFFSKYTIDMNDAQHPNGVFTDTAPDGGYYEYRINSERLKWRAPDNAAWADAGVIIPWTIYQMYGDTSILQSSYDHMVRWIEYCEQTTDGLIRPDWSNYGDWLSIDADTAKDVLATAYFAYSTDLMSRTSRVLGQTEDAERFEKLYRDICLAFEDRFVDGDGRIKGDTQTAYVLALQFNLLSEQNRAKAIEHLVSDIQSRDYHLTTGFLGVGYLLPALTDHGHADVAYRLLQQNTFPSWLYSVKHGATTIWERWDGWTDHNGFQTPTMNSFNHYSLGSVAEWMYKKMAGIGTDREQAGFKHIHFKPVIGGNLSFVNGEFASVYGTIRSSWKVEGKQLTLQVEVPVNTTATVWVPGTNPQCDESDEELVKYSGYSQQDGHRYEIGSGTYGFTATLE